MVAHGYNIMRWPHGDSTTVLMACTHTHTHRHELTGNCTKWLASVLIPLLYYLKVFAAHTRKYTGQQGQREKADQWW